jgi:hypothetical protein
MIVALTPGRDQHGANGAIIHLLGGRIKDVNYKTAILDVRAKTARRERKDRSGEAARRYVGGRGPR